ncbi:hypothetical protein [Vogesella oryzae]|uniref:hypothetical protein n=1 Tax=Vogesella oryzae TaxID=1735285 RepID=UPI0015823E52|nr:hypothetical protein [Vogesella oryzae]
MKYPYEVLVRLSAAGVVGAHVVFAADMENPLTGEVQTQIGNAEPLALADGQAGLSLAEVLGTVASQALLDRESAVAAEALAQQQLSAANQVLQEVTAERDAAQSSIATLQAQIVQLQAALLAVGVQSAAQ